MTTFSSREQTHPAVPPQRRALEPTAADTPGSRNETGRGLPATRPGSDTEHGREETPGSGTRPVGRHPEQAVLPACEGANRSGDAPLNTPDPVLSRNAPLPCGTGGQRVFVLDRHGEPLMPCHPARARALLANGRVRVARAMPFTIRLTDRLASVSEVDGVSLRIDPGSQGIHHRHVTLLQRADGYGYALQPELQQ
jgi:hypothetical protein